MIDEKKNARLVIETDVIAFPPDNIAVSNRDTGLDRDVIVVDPVGVADIDIVIVNTAEREVQAVVKFALHRGNSGAIALSFDARVGTFRWRFGFIGRRV